MRKTTKSCQSERPRGWTGTPAPSLPPVHPFTRPDFLVLRKSQGWGWGWGREEGIQTTELRRGHGPRPAHSSPAPGPSTASSSPRGAVPWAALPSGASPLLLKAQRAWNSQTPRWSELCPTWGLCDILAMGDSPTRDSPGVGSHRSCLGPWVRPTPQRTADTALSQVEGGTTYVRDRLKPLMLREDVSTRRGQA